MLDYSVKNLERTAICTALEGTTDTALLEDLGGTMGGTLGAALWGTLGETLWENLGETLG